MAAPKASRSFLFKQPAEKPLQSLASLELTASDGTGLRLVSLDARVVVDDPLTFTELRLTFENPESRRLEGRFCVGLPQGASVSRFAMKVGGRWQEGEVVERQKARRVYEDFLHRSQDPALLEQEAGNEFSARVFPIEAGERKEIILSYGHEIESSGAPYRLPLRGLPRLDQLRIRALVGRGDERSASSSLGGVASSTQVVEVSRDGWLPDQDFELAIPSSSRAALRDGQCVVMRARPDLPDEPDEITSLLVLVDTSASRALHHGRQCELLLDLLRALADGAGLATPLKLACFDQGVELLFDGPVGDFSGADAERLRGRLPLGASDLGAALRWAAANAGRTARALLITDGISTAGAEDLVSEARALAAGGIQRLDAVSLGGLRDDAALRRLVTAGLPRDGVVCDGDRPLDEIASSLTHATRSGLAVEVPGAEWVWPQRLDGVQPGDERLIYAALPASAEPRLIIGGAPCPAPKVRRGEPLLLERAWVKARIDTLEDLRARPGQSRDVAEALLRQAIALSEKHRVLCAHTALLVLETDADYARHGIDQRALADILTVGLAGIEAINRTRPVEARPEPKHELKQPPRPTAQPKDEIGKSSAKKKAKPPSRSLEEAPKQALSVADEEPHDAEKIDLSQARFSAADEAEEDDDVDPSSGFNGGSEGGSHDGYVADALTEELSIEEPSPAFADEADDTGTQADSSFAEISNEDIDTLFDAPAAPADAVSSQVTLSRRAPPAPQAIAREEAPPPPPPAEPPAPRPASPAPVTPAPMASAPAAPAPAARPAPAPVAAGRAESAQGVEPERVAQRDQGPQAAVAAPAVMAEPAATTAPEPAEPEEENIDERLASWDGQFRRFMELLLRGKLEQAMALALRWRAEAPGDVLSLVALGLSARALGDMTLAARAYGSLIDLFPSRADLRRFAGELLSSLPTREALESAVDTFRKAAENRPDHPSSHRLLGMALLRAGRHREAFEAIASGQSRSYPDKFPGVDRILTEDLALAAAAWTRADPSVRDEVQARLKKARAKAEEKPSLRFVLVWETDANDVDFHIHDREGGHAYYGARTLESGGELYADITQGYGPECFTIRTALKKRAYPYKLQAHYFSRGPMGYGMGSLQIVEHDGEGNLSFEERPYVIQADRAYVDLGVVPGPLAPR